MKTKNTLRMVVKVMLGACSLVGLLYAGLAMAGAADGMALSSIAGNIDTSVVSIASILEDVSLISGVGFVLTSFYSFHTHKNNPTQVPITKPIALLFIGAMMMVFPLTIPTAKNALVGSAQMAKVGGSQMTEMIKE